MCLYPKIIKNRKYLKNKKNGGNIPPVTDERVKYVPIGCQQCIECRRQKKREWQVRLTEDIKQNKNGKFITLTFSNQAIKEINNQIETLEAYERDNEIATRAVRLFLERWRKKYKTSLRHWLITELGHNGTENIHMHGIIWTDETLQEVENIWKYGWIWKGKKGRRGTIINYVSTRTINYMMKYVTKIDIKHSQYKSKILTSPGIGANYTKGTDYKQNTFKGTQTKETYRTPTGHQIAMPVYWRNKIYTEKEREQLWLIKLDKNERWVMGERIDISKGDEAYYKMLKWYRQRNKELGYGDDHKDWSRQQYERDRRAIMLKTRTDNPPTPLPGGRIKNNHMRKTKKT